MLVADKSYHQLRCIFVGVLAALCVLSVSLRAGAQGYLVLHRVSDIKGAPPLEPAIWKDVNLVNPCGMAFSSAGPIWVSNAGTGTSTLYNGSVLSRPFLNVLQPLVFIVPPGSTSSAGTKGTPTGIVFNGTSDFVVSQGGKSGPALFIFATSDGTISGWSPAANFASAIVMVDKPGDVYTGLALGINSAGNFLFVTNVAGGDIEAFDKSFAYTRLAGSFTDPNLPAGFRPFNIQNIRGKLYVTYTSFNSDGLVDIFDTDGNFLQRFATMGTLNLPWGLALAPANFGRFSNDLLVGNLGDGHINAFGPKTGAFLGQLADSRRKPIAIDRLWGLAFGNGGLAGKTNDLLFTAGIQMEKHGLLGTIRWLAY
jgi:uncharacterized protein (TIGR03118 family)